MRPFRIATLLAAAALACAGLPAHSQPPPEPKSESGKTDPKVAKKPPPKAAAKDAAKPVAKDAAKPATKTAPRAAPKDAPNITPKQATKTYTTGPSVLRDKDGNVIPTSPDAYNVDSALPKKK